MTNGNKPIWKKRAGKFDAAVWEQESKIAGGKPTHSVTFRKSWTKDGKNFDEAKMSIFSRELPDAIALLTEVHNELRVTDQK